MFLARTVFHCTKNELKQRLTEYEFCEWLAYYDIEPWGNEWLQTGVIAATVSSTIPRKSTTKLPRPDDFVPYRYDEDKPWVMEIKEKARKLKEHTAQQAEIRKQSQEIQRRRRLYAPPTCSTNIEPSAPINTTDHDGENSPTDSPI